MNMLLSKLNNKRVAQITINAPPEPEPTDVETMLKKGADLWILRVFRELDDAILRLRFFHREYGLLGNSHEWRQSHGASG